MDSQVAGEAAMRLHPFVSTAQRRGGDTSVDNTADNLYHGVSQDTHTERLFGFPGRDTQGPSGSRVSDEAPAPGTFEQEDDVTYDYMDEMGEAPPDSVGPVDPLEIHMQDYTADEGMQEASVALTKARQAGKGSMEILDDMEAAEEAFEAQQQAQHAEQAQHEAVNAEARFLTKLLEHQQGALGQPGSPRSPRGTAGSFSPFAPSSPRLPRTPGMGTSIGTVSTDMRRKVVDRLCTSLLANPAFGAVKEEGKGVEEAARQCEEALFSSSASKMVYQSKASNAVRVAKTAADVSDPPRIASGEPRQEPGPWALLLDETVEKYGDCETWGTTVWAGF
ncbi:hypothetical protein N2152v2_001591 [Parachlorella kessleri]